MQKRAQKMTGTLGVGGSPLLVAFGGEVARFCELVRSLQFKVFKGVSISNYFSCNEMPKTNLRLGGAVGDACPLP